MKSDIEIAQNAKMEPIVKIAEKLGVLEDEIEQYGKYKCKISLDIVKKNENKKDGKLILVTAINPTPAGEGKSTVTVGLGDAFNKIGYPILFAVSIIPFKLCILPSDPGITGTPAFFIKSFAFDLFPINSITL